MTKIDLKKKIIFFLISFILIFLLIEIFLRLINVEYPIFQKHDPIRGFSLLENSSGTWNREGKGKVFINSDGLRDVEHNLKKPVNTIRVAILGDSFAEARSLNFEDTFWHKLESNLNRCKKFHKGKQIEVINFGVSEYGTTQQYLTLKHNAWKYDPDLIVLAFYSGNDVSDNSKKLSKKKYRPYFLFNDEGGYEIDKSYLTSKPYKILSSSPGKIFIQISQYSRIAQLFREVYVQMYFKNKKSEKQNTIQKTTLVEGNVYNPINADWQKAWTTTEKIIKLINLEVKNKKKEFILVSLSTPIQVNPDIEKVKNFKKKNGIKDLFYPEKRLNDFSKKNSIKFIQIAEKMKTIATEKSIFFHGFENTKMGTGHWNKSGHEIASKLISNDICNYY